MTPTTVPKPPSTLETRTDDLLVFVDETGHEEIGQAGHPVFGLGGCAVRSTEYDSEIRGRWRAIRSEFLDAHDMPLHAHALHKLGLSTARHEALVSAIGEFFRRGEFYRLAAIATTATKLEDWIWPYDQVQGALMGRVHDILPRIPAIRRVVLIFEQSERLDRIRREYFRQPHAFEVGGWRVAIEAVAMSKSACEPGLEVADFTMHAAHGHVMARQRPGERAVRRDFRAVFHDVPATRISYMEIMEATAGGDSYSRNGGVWSRGDAAR